MTAEVVAIAGAGRAESDDDWKLELLVGIHQRKLRTGTAVTLSSVSNNGNNALAGSSDPLSLPDSRCSLYRYHRFAHLALGALTHRAR